MVLYCWYMCVWGGTINSHVGMGMKIKRNYGRTDLDGDAVGLRVRLHGADHERGLRLGELARLELRPLLAPLRCSGVL